MIELMAIGEVLWDLFPDGKRLGGAPFNVAYHARQLGTEAGSVSRVGSDALGEEILRDADARGLPLELIQVDPVLPTGTVNVELDEAGNPRFTITENVAWDALALTKSIDTILRGVKAIAFGTLAQRSIKSRETIRGVLARSTASVKLYDINLRPPFYTEEVIRYSLDAATIVKLNDEELATVCELLALPQDEAAACETLCRHFHLDLVCVTKGERGCSVHQASGAFDVPGRSVNVVDTVGAGDAFSAALLVKLLGGEPPAPAAQFANAIGALVATKAGATPAITAGEEAGL
jgi:fructokinase